MKSLLSAVLIMSLFSVTFFGNIQVLIQPLNGVIQSLDHGANY